MAQELSLKRTFDAPRELVFKAWTDPTLVAKWWGPNEFTTPICELDAATRWKDPHRHARTQGHRF